MTEIRFPEHIKYVLSRLEDAGYSAWAVGGCIRDSLLARVPEDWDVTSSALPEETMALFGADALPTGLRHGTVTVKTPFGGVEVTTFRCDGAYSDHRRPDSVRFVRTLEEDLARRDFTVNAMAASLSGELADPFGGRSDLRRKIIRCVGKPERRFEEDALRMFRALRFSAKLGFEIDSGTLAAIYTKAPLAAEIAVERIQVEILKTLPYPCAGVLGIMFSSSLMNSFCAHSETLDFSSVEALPADAGARLAGMCAILERGGQIRTEDFLRRLKCSAEQIRLCSLAVEAVLSGMPENAAAWKRLLHRVGEGAARYACAAAMALDGRDRLPELERVLGSGECYCLDALAVNGRDLLERGLSGREVGASLNRALEHVIEHPQDNDKQTLLRLLDGQII